ncbi:glutathione S-transferase domain-containing protein [Methylophaga lonarensis MPL]|uniref:Glutathione S-transferase domain-containing protein n=1 Tax=Methylophaga lonarensis MPL TaxID=1286106 RepID=M7PS24_9GAMM|nr:glutathione S-transferase [Methylophaga lonarensis]EMR13224.1 glutathione S-transferase domain-containing protein [Methylophaga lonarensis MPL]
MTHEAVTQDILYSFRRCPYAMRARLAIVASGKQVEIREIVLKDKPACMLAASAKATVPVLITAQGHVIDESLDIMLWALSANDPQGWYQGLSAEQLNKAKRLIAENDSSFKYYLDRYKYADRYPEQDAAFYRKQACLFLAELETQLQQHSGLIGQQISYADMAIAPFIRQFAMVDSQWFFQQNPFPAVKDWLESIIYSPQFETMMVKLPQWQPGDSPRLFPSDF